MSASRSRPLSPDLTEEPTPEPSSVVNASSTRAEPEDEWEVVGADDVGAKGDPFPPSETELGRERLLAEAGRLYGRDTVRERAALLDGSHPLHRLKPSAA
jgi:hypothetical protein